MNNDILVVMALPAESQGVFEREGIPVLHTGLGKVNAALSLGRELGKREATKSMPRLVVNFGSAGSRRFRTGELVACRRFVQRDMDVRGLGFALGVTPFEDIPAMIEHKKAFENLPEGICGSGDRFETDESAVPCDVIDMEAYALAKACLVSGAAFACAKFITDGADSSAGADWEANLPRAAARFLDAYRGLNSHR